jgi:hypothetical protein
VKKKSNQTAADTAATAPSTLFPIAATATITTTSSSATFVFDQATLNGSRIPAAPSGPASAAATAARSRVRWRAIATGNRTLMTALATA